MRCAECRTMIGGEHVHYPYFSCPDCGCDLCVPPSFRVKANLLGAAIALSICYFFGLRSLALFICGIPASIAVGAVLTVIGTVVMPPTLQKYWRPGTLGLKL